MFRLLLLLSLIIFPSLEAAFTVKNGKFVRVENVPTMSLEEHYNLGKRAYERGEWKEAIKNFRIVTFNSPSGIYGKEAFYPLAISYYNVREYEFANTAFSSYLENNTNPPFFDSCIEYKFDIAEKFRCGTKRRPFGTKQMPKVLAGDDLAIDIYEEVIAAMPSNEMAARALYSKGFLLWKAQAFDESVAAFQMLIKRFPKHEFAPECYLIITDVYLDKAKKEMHNPDLIPLAEITYSRFKRDFPRADQLSKAEQNVVRIKEVHAMSFASTGEFYERTKRPGAAVIYYQNAILEYPGTSAAGFSRERLQAIAPTALDAVEEELAKCHTDRS